MSPTNYSCRKIAGFTLLELVVVLVLVGLVLGVAFPVLQKTNEVLSFKSSRSDIKNFLIKARVQAISLQRKVSLTLDKSNSLINSSEGNVLRFPQDVDVVFSGVESSRRSTVIFFEKDGSSSGGQIFYKVKDRQVTFVLDWVTGGVSEK